MRGAESLTEYHSLLAGVADGDTEQHVGKGSGSVGTSFCERTAPRKRRGSSGLCQTV